MTSYTVGISRTQAEALRILLVERGFELGKTQYALFSAKKPGLNVVVYEKGPKVLIQGKDAEDFMRFSLEPEILGEARLGYEEVLNPEMFAPHFGIDESGKGDYFGPLVIAGVFTDKKIAQALQKLGVTDSKKISSAEKIDKLAEAIQAVPGIAFAVVSIGPERYNEIYENFGNLNRLLAWGHAQVIEKLAAERPDCPRALSDQFAKAFVLEAALKKKNLNIQLEQKTKAESDLAVAAASILARARFVNWLRKTSKSSGVELSPGVSKKTIPAAREILRIHGDSGLKKVAKLHFKTTQEVLSDEKKSQF